VAGGATDARKTAVTARHAARSRKLPAGAATDAGQAALATRTAAGTTILATGAAVPVAVAAGAAGVLLEDNMHCCAASRRRASRESFSCRHRRNSNRCSNSATNHQRFDQIKFR
jgi:hypothetical protein